MTEKPPPNPKFEDYEKEASPFEETVLAADTGTVTFRDYGEGNVWLGVRAGNRPNSPPEVFVRLTQRQQVTLSSLFIECRRVRRCP